MNVAGSNVTSEETSPEKVQSPEKEDSDENNDIENKEKSKEKGKNKMGYLSCPGYGCNGYAPYGRPQYYQEETVQEIKCKKCNWKVPRAGEGMRGIIEKHCKECHLGGKRKDREFKDDKDIGTIEEQENTKPKFKNIFEDNEYDKAETSTNQEEIEKWLKNNSDYE